MSDHRPGKPHEKGGRVPERSMIKAGSEGKIEGNIHEASIGIFQSLPKEEFSVPGWVCCG
jgi:hypothetical protein